MPWGEIVVIGGHSITAGYFKKRLMRCTRRFLFPSCDCVFSSVDMSVATSSSLLLSTVLRTCYMLQVDERGIRLFYTGDIGKFHPDGCLEIIIERRTLSSFNTENVSLSLGRVYYHFA
ncbi:hypothetical protein TorRG33x02_161950 [Trema orientale]|uniref:Uncharacterized protein n=1 Tax=Trema orientale TaxID=63057 RepID=A0A2P5ER26_TREOI|nr:hypothetical protein TorRG33x02_161950 [Trema orientale]